MITANTRPGNIFLGKNNSLHFKIKWFKLHNFAHIGHQDEGSLFWSGNVFHHFTLCRPDWFCSSCFQNMWESGCAWQKEQQEHHSWQFFSMSWQKNWVPDHPIPTAVEDLIDHRARNFPSTLIKFLDGNSPGKTAWCFPATLQKVQKWEGCLSWDSSGISRNAVIQKFCLLNNL